MTGKRHQGGESCLHFGKNHVFPGRAVPVPSFAGCTLRCVYCQNREIAAGRMGRGDQPFTPGGHLFELKEQGAENINLVTPSHYADKIMSAIRMAKERGFDLPFVYNCSGYEKVGNLKTADWPD